MASLENLIRERAYHLWQASGSAGSADAHWVAAEHAVLSSLTGAKPASAATSAAPKATNVATKSIRKTGRSAA